MTPIHRLALACTVITATTFAMFWALAVPFFAEPDELAHADYVLALYDVGKPFFVANASPVRTVTPELRYLARAVRYRENRYATVVRLPTGYGTSAYFTDVDRRAPQPNHGVPPAGSPLPYVMFSYPVGYYIVAALAMHAADLARPLSLTTRIFAARLVGVVCLPFTLLLAYGVFVRLRLARRTALLATAAVGLMPLTLWVSGYIQPDVATTLLLTAAVYSSLRSRDAPRSFRWHASLTASLVALAFVKQHYAAATLVATFAAALSAADARRRVRTIAATFIPALLALAVATRIGPAGPIGVPHLAAVERHAVPLSAKLAAFGAYAVTGLGQVFGGGDAFKDFWWIFGLNGNSVVPHFALPTVRTVLLTCTIASLLAFVTRTRYVVGRLGRVWSRRSRLTAARLFCGDAITNVYFLTSAILIAAYALSDGSIWLEGRYWLPVIVPFAGFILTRNLRALPGTARRRAALLLASGWATYSIVTAPLGVGAVMRDYYDRARRDPTVEPYAEIRTVRYAPSCRTTRNVHEIPPDCAVTVEGYAVDGSVGLPAATVFVTVDGKRAVRARTGAPSPKVRDAYNDDALAAAGFIGILDARLLTPGRHTIGLAISERGEDRQLTMRTSLERRVIDVR